MGHTTSRDMTATAHDDGSTGLQPYAALPPYLPKHPHHHLQYKTVSSQSTITSSSSQSRIPHSTHTMQAHTQYSSSRQAPARSQCHQSVVHACWLAAAHAHLATVYLHCTTAGAQASNNRTKLQRWVTDLSNKRTAHQPDFLQYHPISAQLRKGQSAIVGDRQTAPRSQRPPTVDAVAYVGPLRYAPAVGVVHLLVSCLQRFPSYSKLRRSP
jgi:hypothetical protein